MAETYSAGVVTAYGAAVRGGYTGTYEEFCAEQAKFAENAAAVAQAKEDVETMQGQVEQAAATFTGTTVPAAVTTVQEAGAAQVQAVQDEGTMQAAAVETVGAQQKAAVEAAGSDAVDAVETAETAATDTVTAAQTAAVQAVQAESTTQQAAIQTKGEQTIASIPADYTALTEEVNDVKSAFDEKVNSHYTTVDPENWFDQSEETTGILYADGTTGEATNRCYTGYIPVTSGDVIRQYYGNAQMLKIYRRNICAYDAQKNILASKGTDSSSNAEWTVPSGVSYIRMTFDKTYDDKAMITKNLVPTEYSAYFEPYDKIAEDFLTPESKAVLQGVKDETAAYGYAMPMGSNIRLTVGIPEKWYYKSMLTPDALITNLDLGTQYSNRENDGLSIPNEESLNSSNGYRFTVFNQNLQTVFSYQPNSGYGLPRKIMAENLQNCSALVIGDSTVDFGTMTQRMLDYFTSKSKTLTLIGTRGSGNNRNEGRAGWKATDYLTNKTYEGVVNPFYNPSSETFDFSYYITNQGYSAPDFVVVQLGINDLYNSNISAIEPTWNAIKAMIDSIIAYNSSIHVLLNLPTTPNSDQSKHSIFLPLYQNRVVRYNQYAMEQAREIYGSSKVRPTYCHLILDPATDIRDNVHPTNAGFEKMAKEVINQINCWQNGV